jgi:NADH-quinone oxidoreductase subunit L
MFEINTLLILIPALPLVATLLTAVLGKPLLGTRSHLPAVVAIAAAFAASVCLLFQVQREAQQTADQPAAGRPIGFERIVPLWTWAEISHADSPRPLGEGQRLRALTSDRLALTLTLSQRERGPEHVLSENASPGDFQIEVVLRADPLTAIMLATVTFVSLLVAVYSIGYMHGDPGYWRFYTYICLFVFSMTMLVSVSNFVLLYVFWEAVGLCSYLLIGFWFHKPEAAAAGKKAFLVNRVGDFGFALGVFLLWTTYGTLNFHDAHGVAGILGQTRLAASHLYVGGGVATAICLLLMLGACGKSAQFPLHVWLPDAMEGPTPVSALIHAATMVTAGVYMVARCTPLFLASADAQTVVAVIGGLTALMAAVIALTQTDLKRILAYSTISQLGYMFLGLGAGSLLGITAGMFHLFTHAFFKALLFLGAGSVMHAMGGVIDIRRFGGLWRRLPSTHWTFLFGCLALAGVFPLAGFWSKDLVLAALHERAAEGPAATIYYGLYLAGLAGALLTAIYTFRAYFLTFFGPERIPPEAGHHAHESPGSMTWPLAILAVCALLVGAYFGLNHGFADFLARTPSLAYITQTQEKGAGSVAQLRSDAANAGGARPLFQTHEHAPEDGNSHLTIALLSQAVAAGGIVLAALLYLGGRRRADGVARLAKALGLYQLSRNKFYFDPIYNALLVAPLRGLAKLSFNFDRGGIDGLVDLCGRLPTLLGAMLRPLQNGMIQFYALAMVLGLLLLLAALFI